MRQKDVFETEKRQKKGRKKTIFETKKRPKNIFKKDDFETKKYEKKKDKKKNKKIWQKTIKRRRYKPQHFLDLWVQEVNVLKTGLDFCHFLVLKSLKKVLQLTRRTLQTDHCSCYYSDH